MTTHTTDHPQHSGDDKICTCASFFTVRGVHKPDCPLYSGREEMIEEVVSSFGDMLSFIELHTGESERERFRATLHSLVERVERKTHDAVGVVIEESMWQCPEHGDEFRVTPPLCEECNQCLEVNIVLQNLKNSLAAMRSAKLSDKE